MVERVSTMRVENLRFSSSNSSSAMHWRGQPTFQIDQHRSKKNSIGTDRTVDKGKKVT
jgi:hypothetical protein